MTCSSPPPGALVFACYPVGDQAPLPVFFMPTLLQIEANRRNAKRSTGPRTLEGKAVSRFNALKTGIDAKSQIIPGEDSAVLDALVAEYLQQFPPATPQERALIDMLVTAEWQLRRYRVVETQLWDYQMDSAFQLNENCPLGHAFSRGDRAFTRLQRLLDSAQRAYLRTLKELQQSQTQRQPAVATGPQVAVPFPDPPAATPELPGEPLSNQPLRPVIGFVPANPPAPAALASPCPVPSPAHRPAIARPTIPAANTPRISHDNRLPKLIVYPNPMRF